MRETPRDTKGAGRETDFLSDPVSSFGEVDERLQTAPMTLFLLVFIRVYSRLKGIVPDRRRRASSVFILKWRRVDPADGLRFVACGFVRLRLRERQLESR